MKHWGFDRIINCVSLGVGLLSLIYSIFDLPRLKFPLELPGGKAVFFFLAIACLSFLFLRRYLRLQSKGLIAVGLALLVGTYGYGSYLAGTGKYSHRPQSWDGVIYEFGGNQSTSTWCFWADQGLAEPIVDYDFTSTELLDEALEGHLFRLRHKKNGLVGYWTPDASSDVFGKIGTVIFDYPIPHVPANSQASLDIEFSGEEWGRAQFSIRVNDFLIGTADLFLLSRTFEFPGSYLREGNNQIFIQYWEPIELATIQWTILDVQMHLGWR